MEEVDRERQGLVEPQRAVGPEADVAPLVVGDLAHPRGLIALGLVVALRGEPLGALGDIFDVERGGALGMEGDGCARERESERAPPRAGAGYTNRGGRHGPVGSRGAVRSASPKKFN